MENVTIAGVGSCIANHCVSNYDLEHIVDTSNDWIVQRTGIETRYISHDKNTSQLAFEAAENAIKDANIDAHEIDLIIVATLTPDNFTPSCACLVQEKLGLNDAKVMAFDVNAACSGFIYAIHIASLMMQQYQCALVIGAETLSKLMDWNDRNTCVLFGDGAGAVILKRSLNHRLCAFARSIGDNNETLIAKGLALTSDLHNCNNANFFLKMDGKEVFRFAIKAMQESIEQVCQLANVSIQNIDLIIPHQANIRIIQHVQKKMDVSMDKFYVNLQKYGNTSAASIAIALSEAKHTGRLHKGMKVVLTGFGAGFTYGAIYMEI